MTTPNDIPKKHNVQKETPAKPKRGETKNDTKRKSISRKKNPNKQEQYENQYRPLQHRPFEAALKNWYK